MPKRPSAQISSEFVVSDDEDNTAPASKPLKKPRPNTTPNSSSAQATAALKDDNGDPYWPLNASGTRRVTLNTFRGKTMVNVREYYEKDGAMLPGKKGISLVMDQWAALVALLPQIEGTLAGMGESVPRPVYGGASAGSDADGMEVEQGGSGDAAATSKAGKAKGPGTKPNYEDTSDEDSHVGEGGAGLG